MMFRDVVNFLRGGIFSKVLDIQQGGLRGRSPNSSTVYPWNKCVAEVHFSLLVKDGKP